MLLKTLGKTIAKSTNITMKYVITTAQEITTAGKKSDIGKRISKLNQIQKQEIKIYLLKRELLVSVLNLVHKKGEYVSENW